MSHREAKIFVQHFFLQKLWLGYFAITNQRSQNLAKKCQICVQKQKTPSKITFDLQFLLPSNMTKSPRRSSSRALPEAKEGTQVETWE